MDDQKVEVEKMDDFMLPGFRFHPTDEELVGFYLKKKIQHRSLPIELIKQVDIYKYDPWDLPTLAPSGEKEWYFYCPRDRKYRNSARPNRVTGAGFWKATGTDRPIYSSDGSKCIGLKKSLVFYKGRAAKGMKTDWMMHEFRLPSLVEPAKKVLDKTLPPNDAWAICRIFKKTNSMAQRAMSQSWVSSLTEDKKYSDYLTHSNNLKPISTDGFSALETSSYRPVNQTVCKTASFPLPYTDFPNGFLFTSADTPDLFDLGVDHVSKSIGFSPFAATQVPFDNLSMNHGHDHGFGSGQTGGFPFGLGSDGWNSKVNMPWESPSTCPSEMSTTTYSCHTN